eukprot:TRINITY_DN508_c0_g4_i1.p1 TRINITY_DN508_c0_g4~~TRINITY_DN508_c0_g4_i1.p1  ORF type:complete len:452 (-),score=87.30 TRINITY_DN508_c0_g4_i1:34-1389(-)
MAADSLSQRTPEPQRLFRSSAIERAIAEFQQNVANKDLVNLFANCFPNTLDTTVFFTPRDKEFGKPDTYVITGDIDAMWLRDSTAQVWGYFPFINQDEPLKNLIAGVINRQTFFINHDPYANAFYRSPAQKSEWQDDETEMKPGVHERKWEIDSLCYTIRLAHRYWQETLDDTPFDDDWHAAQKLILQTFREQQKKTNRGPYHFQRKTERASDTLPLDGYGYPIKPVGLISSSFRPSDDATLFSFLIPSNFFAVLSLRQSAEMLRSMKDDISTVDSMLTLAQEIESALLRYGVIEHPLHGQILAYEVDGFGSQLLMDDANVPSLLSLPYLNLLSRDDPLYQRTRKFILSESNPFFYKGLAGEGVGSPHTGEDRIWPISIAMRALTSNEESEICCCVEWLRKSQAGTGFMHESFHKDDPSLFTRKWFAWANSLVGELLWKIYKEKPLLLSSV